MSDYFEFTQNCGKKYFIHKSRVMALEEAFDDHSKRMGARILINKCHHNENSYFWPQECYEELKNRLEPSQPKEALYAKN